MENNIFPVFFWFIKELLGRFATCVRDIVDWHSSRPKSESSGENDCSSADNEEDDGLLSWLSWFCAQDDL
jgi:hypothetical protein